MNRTALRAREVELQASLAARMTARPVDQAAFDAESAELDGIVELLYGDLGAAGDEAGAFPCVC